jgi:diketogulonate reductase-like aldo/keto reductase
MSKPKTPEQPSFVYGTAWKKDATRELVKTALKAGFRAIDTANQPKHYSEPLVGDALKDLEGEGIARDSLFIQTKFTPLNGQDHRVPYDPQAGLEAQVRQSFESSLRHLGTDYIDSFLLHGPYSYPGLGEEDWEVWHAIAQIHTAGHARLIGVSNVNALQLAALIAQADVKPMVVQNRCFANRGWDRQVREICQTHGITYQGFFAAHGEPLRTSKFGRDRPGAKAGRLSGAGDLSVCDASGDGAADRYDEPTTHARRPSSLRH